MKKCEVKCCKNKPCCCGLKFISIPASLADEMTPKNGAFCNSIVRYEDTGEVYIYSAEGIPVLVKEANAS